MNAILSLLFDNEVLETELEAFCAGDPAYVKAETEFYETAHIIAQQVGFDRYDAFERRFTAYLHRASDLYYLFGLGLLQEILEKIG